MCITGIFLVFLVVAALARRAWRWMLPALLVYLQVGAPPIPPSREDQHGELSLWSDAVCGAASRMQAYVLALLIFQLSAVQDNLPENDNWAYAGLVQLPPPDSGTDETTCARLAAPLYLTSFAVLHVDSGAGTGYYLAREATLIVFVALAGMTNAIRERICAATGEVRLPNTASKGSEATWSTDRPPRFTSRQSHRVENGRMVYDPEGNLLLFKAEQQTLPSLPSSALASQSK